jgi:uncharacterized membrane protein YbaN (DUF454 family)
MMLARAGWLAGGLLAVAVGGLGVVVPGLPTTVFFVAAAWCFSRSSPRLERWVLGLPKVGPMVAGYRAGLGMPRRAKVVAVVTMAVFVALSAWLLGSLVASSAVVALGLVGAWFVLWRVPTREAVLAGALATTPAGADPNSGT